MKFYFILSFFCLFFQGTSAISRPANMPKYPSKSPAVELPPSVAFNLFGRSDYLNPNGQLSCYTLLNKSWAYQNAQATALCNEAEISCIRHGLLQQFIYNSSDKAISDHDKKRFPLQVLKEGLAASSVEVKLKLTGCAVAIEAVSTNSDSIINQSGFAPPGSSVEQLSTKGQHKPN